MNEWSIECRRLSKCYGHTTALRELTFGLPRGKAIGLLGPNGSGRFTPFAVIGGALHTLQAWQALFTRVFCFPLFFYLILGIVFVVLI